MAVASTNSSIALEEFPFFNSTTPRSVIVEKLRLSSGIELNILSAFSIWLRNVKNWPAIDLYSRDLFGKSLACFNSSLASSKFEFSSAIDANSTRGLIHNCAWELDFLK